MDAPGVSVAEAEAELVDLWDTYGLSGERPTLDFRAELVVFFTEQKGCGGALLFGFALTGSGERVPRIVDTVLCASSPPRSPAGRCSSLPSTAASLRWDARCFEPMPETGSVRTSRFAVLPQCSRDPSAPPSNQSRPSTQRCPRFIVGERWSGPLSVRSSSCRENMAFGSGTTPCGCPPRRSARATLAGAGLRPDGLCPGPGHRCVSPSGMPRLGRSSHHLAEARTARPWPQEAAGWDRLMEELAEDPVLRKVLESLPPYPEP